MSEPAYLDFVTNNGVPARLLLVSESNHLIGCHSGCVLATNSASVSWQHAEVWNRDAHWYVKNVSAGAVLLLNGRKTKKSKLKPGDEFQCGGISLRFGVCQDPQDTTRYTGDNFTFGTATLDGIKRPVPDTIDTLDEPSMMGNGDTESSIDGGLVDERTTRTRSSIWLTLLRLWFVLVVGKSLVYGSSEEVGVTSFFGCFLVIWGLLKHRARNTCVHCSSIKHFETTDVDQSTLMTVFANAAKLWLEGGLAGLREVKKKLCAQCRAPWQPVRKPPPQSEKRLGWFYIGLGLAIGGACLVLSWIRP